MMILTPLWVVRIHPRTWSCLQLLLLVLVFSFIAAPVLALVFNAMMSTHCIISILSGENVRHPLRAPAWRFHIFTLSFLLVYLLSFGEYFFFQ
jgi:membrane-anchored glycerophosphoryl diester phosphodiesterase (GDPDase)